MERISIANAKNRLSELIVRVEAGEVIDVTRHGKPVARLIAAEQPADAVPQRARVNGVFRKLALLRQGLRLEGDLKQLAREGLD
jgi:prevent-host-death family protein